MPLCFCLCCPCASDCISCVGSMFTSRIYEYFFCSKDSLAPVINRSQCRYSFPIVIECNDTLLLTSWSTSLAAQPGREDPTLRQGYNAARLYRTKFFWWQFRIILNNAAFRVSFAGDWSVEWWSVKGCLDFLHVIIWKLWNLPLWWLLDTLHVCNPQTKPSV